MGLVANLSLYQMVITTFLMNIRIKLKIRKIHDGGISFELFLRSVNFKTSQKFKRASVLDKKEVWKPFLTHIEKM